MNKTTKYIIGIIIILLVIWGIYSIVQKPKEAIGEPIKIGFIGPLTGELSSIGSVSKAAVELAVEEVNSDGGINGRPIEVIYEDGQCNTKVAISAANKLINIDKVPVIIGGLCSTETSAFGPMAMENEVIVFSYCSTAPKLSELGKYFFRSYPSDSLQGKFSAEYAYNDLGARKIAVLYHISDYGIGIKDVFKQRFEELGGKILIEEGTPQDSRDYRTVLIKLNNLNPDIIFMPTYPDGAVAALKQAQELGITTKFLGGDGWDDPDLQKEVSGRGDFIFTGIVNSSPEDFKNKILAKTGGDQVPVCTSNAYDNMKIIAQVIKKVGLDTNKIQEELHKIKYNGEFGYIEFYPNGDLITANYTVKKIEDGKAIEIK